MGYAPLVRTPVRTLAILPAVARAVKAAHSRRRVLNEIISSLRCAMLLAASDPMP